MLCAWELRNFGVSSKLAIDHFQGQVSPAWEELAGGAEMAVYFKGDQCNELIATADIFVRLIKLSMVQNKLFFTKSDIKKTIKLFGNVCVEYFIGKSCLNKITPNNPTRIRAKHLIQHPIFYLVKENPEEAEEELVIQNSPFFNKLIKKVNELGGCLKFYHPDDTKLIKEGDYLVIFGKRGDTIFEKLINLKYAIKKFH
ncbi:MAG: hypothetical protein AABW85_05025 [archaeon]